ncbi:hypothetical protein AB833_30715 [Chromatiales bacterium (ex Bugula neritina AB1)]|nr:hypothetical protein AB833_30715 [Chromatiales bacterium (ex Bugula neritina AB1)]
MTDNQTVGKPVLLHFQSSGQASAERPDIVILHGLFGDGDNWRGQAEKLSDRFRVHLIDLRNHGASPHTDSMSYHSMAADVALTCDTIGIESMHLIGHSMGGKTAMQFALDLPHRLHKLIIVDIAPRQYPHHHQQIIEGLQQIQSNHIDSRQSANKILAGYIENDGIRAFLLKNLRRQHDGSYRLRFNLDTISGHYESIAAGVTGSGSYTGPTLFIKGANSDYLAAADQPLVQSLFPNARLKTIGGAGHWPHSEKPDVTHKIISDFLA